MYQHRHPHRAPRRTFSWMCVCERRQSLHSGNRKNNLESHWGQARERITDPTFQQSVCVCVCVADVEGKPYEIYRYCLEKICIWIGAGQMGLTGETFGCLCRHHVVNSIYARACSKEQRKNQQIVFEKTNNKREKKKKYSEFSIYSIRSLSQFLVW